MGIDQITVPVVLFGVALLSVSGLAIKAFAAILRNKDKLAAHDKAIALLQQAHRHIEGDNNEVKQGLKKLLRMVNDIRVRLGPHEPNKRSDGNDDDDE